MVSSPGWGHEKQLPNGRLFTVPYFSVKSMRSIVEFEQSPDLGFCMRAKPGESTKYPWVGVLVVNNVGVGELTAPILPPTHGHFVLSPGFARIQKPRWRPLELNDRSQRLHGKIGDCEQSNPMGTNGLQ